MTDSWKLTYMFSLNGEFPILWQDIPERIRMSNGSTRTDKETYTQDMLKDAGYVFVDQFGIENFNETTRSINWDGTEFSIVDLSVPEDDGTLADI